jgi:DNA-binding CsgD family transcriptional regulator
VDEDDGGAAAGAGFGVSHVQQTRVDLPDRAERRVPSPRAGARWRLCHSGARERRADCKLGCGHGHCRGSQEVAAVEVDLIAHGSSQTCGSVFGAGAPRRVPPELAVAVAEHLGDDALTNREIDVLLQVAAGHDNKIVADNLYIAEETVKTHVSSILSKLAAKDRTHAVTIALKRGIIEI